MKILILPSIYITNYKQKNYDLLKSFFRNVLNKQFSFEAAKSHFILNEHYHYSHIPTVNGKENTYIIGDYFKDYKTKTIPEDTRYPSLHSSPSGTHISYDDAIDKISFFDAVLVGVKTGEYGRKLLKLANKKNIFSCIIDYADDFEVYKKSNYQNHKLICRNFEYMKDFQIFFKHDIPLDLDIKYLEPLAPMPIKFENYPNLQNIFFKDKTYDFSFVGRIHNNIHNARKAIINLLENVSKKYYIKEYINNDIKRLSLKNYCEILNKSKICLSPWGKVWDSARHPESAVYGNVPLIPKPNCKLANNLSLNDDNAIVYETEKYGDIFKIKNRDLINERLNFCINNENEFSRLSKNWYLEIKNKNTLLERAKYILNKIEIHMKN